MYLSAERRPNKYNMDKQRLGCSLGDKPQLTQLIFIFQKLIY